MRYSIPLLLTLLTICCKSPELILSKGAIDSDVHKNNIGLITFMNETIPFNDYSEKDFKDEVVLSEDRDLSFRMFLGETLTSYLHPLAPEMTVNELCKKGNFSLTFYLGNEEVFSENVNVNAGSCWYKNSATACRIPLVSQEEVDHWGRFLWSRFMYRDGGQDLLNEGSHRLRIEVRPYLALEEILFGEVIASGEVNLKVLPSDVVVADELVSIQSIEPYPGLSISSAPFDKDLIRKLNRDIIAKQFKDITSIVVLSEGEILIEEYFNDSDRQEKHNTRSVGKSFMSAIMGIAIDEGHIASTELTLSDFYDLSKYAHPSKSKENVTIKDLLTMSSGFEGNDNDLSSIGNEENMYPTDNWVKFGLDLPMRLDKEWSYFTAGSVILGDILHHAVPGGLEKYAEEKLFEPLGIKYYIWQYTPQGVANTAGGIQMNALDFAKFGHLYKNKGLWKKNQIISPKWIAKSFEKHAILDESTQEYYGYQFWQKSFEIDGTKYITNYCTGTGGNKIYIFQDLPLVIVITAKAFRLPQAHSQVDRMMKKYLLPAVLAN